MKLHLNQQIDQILNYLEPFWKFTDCHMVNFLTDNHWENFIPQNIQDSIKNDSDVETAIEEVFWNPKETTKFIKLKKFIDQSKKYYLENLDGLTISTNELNTILKVHSNMESVKINEFMNEKKRHEVEITASLIDNLRKSVSNSEFCVVDAGDGKGYLSSRLALEYGIKVLGIDSNEINTVGAQERNKKLQRYWNGLLERADIVKSGQVPPRRSKKKLQRKNENQNHTSTQYKTINKFITSDIDIKSLINNEFKLETIYKICLTGLHTCGNLAPTCLKLFVTDPSIEFLCNIGCCYHLLKEEFSDVEFFENKEINSLNKEYGFPMSNYLRKKKVKLGRNCRMLATQSTYRSINNKEYAGISLYYRALLEVIILRTYPELQNKIQVGKLKKIYNFNDYLFKCSEKININLTIDNLNQFEEKLKSQQFLNLFYLIRMSFAPILETLILLDRLLYLKEKDFEKSYLIRLFDPILSPRCYALISIK